MGEGCLEESLDFCEAEMLDTLSVERADFGRAGGVETGLDGAFHSANPFSRIRHAFDDLKHKRHEHKPYPRRSERGRVSGCNLRHSFSPAGLDNHGIASPVRAGNAGGRGMTTRDPKPARGRGAPSTPVDEPLRPNLTAPPGSS
jgi:hypothetical protein